MTTTVPPRVAHVLLVAGGLAEYRRRHAGQDAQVDAVLLRLTMSARRHRLGPVPRTRQSDPPHPDPVDHEWVSTAEAAKTVGCDSSTIQRAIRAGHLPARRIGNSYAITVADVAAYAAETRATGAPRRRSPAGSQPRPPG